MNPLLIIVSAQIAEALAAAVTRYTPEYAEKLARLIYNPAPTLQEWLDIFKEAREILNLKLPYEVVMKDSLTPPPDATP